MLAGCAFALRIAAQKAREARDSIKPGVQAPGHGRNRIPKPAEWGTAFVTFCILTKSKAPSPLCSAGALQICRRLRRLDSFLGLIFPGLTPRALCCQLLRRLYPGNSARSRTRSNGRQAQTRHSRSFDTHHYRYRQKQTRRAHLAAAHTRAPCKVAPREEISDRPPIVYSSPSHSEQHTSARCRRV